MIHIGIERPTGFALIGSFLWNTLPENTAMFVIMNQYSRLVGIEAACKIKFNEGQKNTLIYYKPFPVCLFYYESINNSCMIFYK